MKDLSEIEDEYKNSFDELMELYKKEVSLGKNKKDLRKKFKTKLNKIISKRDSAINKYIKKHRSELLGFEKKNKPKEKKGKKEYRAYHINFKKSFFKRIQEKLDLCFFKIHLILRNFWYNFIPSKIKFFFFRFNFILRAFFYDIKMIFVKISRKISKSNSKLILEIKKIFAWFSMIFSKIASFFKLCFSKALQFFKNLVEKLKPKKKDEEKTEGDSPEKTEESNNNTQESGGDEKSDDKNEENTASKEEETALEDVDFGEIDEEVESSKKDDK